MKIKYTFNTESSENYLLDFLNKDYFEHIDFKDFSLIRENRLIIFNSNSTSKEIKNIQSSDNSSFLTFLLLPTSLKESLRSFTFTSSFIKIFYPINIKKFEKLIFDNTKILSFFYKDIIVGKDNFMLNKKNNKKIYLTETESQIISLLFSEKKIKKEKIKKEILNLQTTIDTKSLESHLSRIRKKLIQIDSVISIISVENQSILIN